MIIVSVEAVVDPGAVERVREALRAMEKASRAEEGCLTYAFSVDITDPSTVRISERWRSMDDLRIHFATPHMAEFQKAIAALSPTKLDIKAFEVAREVALPS
ncbi:MAG TPA: putative quinol monooxygenase [Candidatus Binatia bacterium]|nr:putative quinol monooxygenase [Candidatus Binatia bacterium]